MDREEIVYQRVSRGANDMVDIDWGDLSPTHAQRARVQARVAELAHLQGPVMLLGRRGSGYEARLVTAMPDAPAEVRLSDGDLASVVDRACQLLVLVAHPPSTSSHR